MEVYYFSSDHVYEEGQWTAKDIFVYDKKFTTTLNSKERAKEMDVRSFWIGPGKVYLDLAEPVYDQSIIENTITKYVHRGCSLLICQLPLNTNHRFIEKFQAFKEKLASVSPIDFMIAPRIPASRLSTEQIKFFGREKVPFILIDEPDEKSLKKVKWSWIQQTQSFSKTPIKYMSDQYKKNFKVWDKVCKKYSIETFYDELTIEPLSKEILRLTGISPHKGEFLHQGCADYNLFDLSSIPSIEDRSNFRYHKAIPVIVVSNGVVIKTSNVVQADAAKGEYTTVTIPKHFL
ncbi:hypothetical protein NC661_00300 [Aquibacillus koreensis]|uniref:Uncharacterized protein n=1 Tax=Aquibacillus koreensis TaxID=279446 RepID=A0A9X4AGM2_9BACI|nr:hypothetical protein [Aquibacillus koreensis]MCT2537378.1 hypothetical protein [Aquibacillus koreensis]MDC3418824.1 hypothetical protein [Aquibacillus koreensis]